MDILKIWSWCLLYLQRYHAFERYDIIPLKGMIPLQINFLHCLVKEEISRYYLEISSITKLLQFPCWKLTMYHLFVDILSRYDLL